MIATDARPRGFIQFRSPWPDHQWQPQAGRWMHHRSV